MEEAATANLEKIDHIVVLMLWASPRSVDTSP
jgi:hypothetical protein